MKHFRIVAIILLCLALLSISVPAFAESTNESDDSFNFSYYMWDVNYQNRKKYRRGWTSQHDYTLFFDFDNELAVLYDRHYYHYSDKVERTYSIYSLEQDTTGLYHLYGIEGNEFDWCFAKKEHSSLFGLFSSTSIEEYDNEGNRTMDWSDAKKVEEQPVERLIEAGFYGVYNKPSDVKKEFLDANK